MGSAEQDLNSFDEMIAENYFVYIGSKRAIRVLRAAFENIGIKISPNVILYEIKGVAKKHDGKVLRIDDLAMKIEILKHMHIL